MLIDPTVDAKTAIIRLKAGQSLQVRGVWDTDEVIALEIPNGAGSWRGFKEGGTTVQLDEDNDQFAALGNTLVRVNKPTTTNAVGVALI